MNEITLDVGREHALILTGLGSAGYAWEWSIEGRQDVVSVSFASVGESPRASPGDLPPNSFNLDTKVTVTGLAPGRVTLELRLQRPWERDEPPLKEEVLHIRVQ